MAYAAKVEAQNEVERPLWRALRATEAPATIAELHLASRAHPNAIQLRLKRWSRVGFVEIHPAEPPRYEISEKGRGRDAPPTTGSLSLDAWQALRRLRGPVTLEELIAATGCADRPLYCRLRRWRRSGWIRKIDQLPQRYALSPAAPDVAEPPRVTLALDVEQRRPSARVRMWVAMRVLKRFNVPMLQMTAEVKRRNCEDFINLLSRAGYVRRLDYGVGRCRAGNLGAARTWSTYQLVRNTGPKAPTITNPPGGPRQLVDANTGASVILARGVRAMTREA